MKSNHPDVEPVRRGLIKRILPFLVLLFGIFVAAGVRSGDIGQHIDFALFYFGGIAERSGSYTDTGHILELARNAGRVVSGDGVFGSPTLVGLIFQPLSFTSLSTAQTIFDVAAIVALVVAVRRAVSDRWWPAWLAVALVSTSNITAYVLGNFAIFTTALVLFAYGSFRTRRHRQGGVALAIAIVCKLYPAFLVVPLLVKRNKASVIWTVVPAALLLAATPFTLGWSDTWAALRQTIDISSYVHPWSDNSGLPGTVRRATGSQLAAEWTTRLCVAISAVILWRLRNVQLSVLFALAVLLLTLSQGISWNMYYGVTLVAVLALRDLQPKKLVWMYMGVGYLLANGYELHPTLTLFGLPRGLPLTVGLLIMTCALLAAIRTRAAGHDRNDTADIEAETAER